MPMFSAGGPGIPGKQGQMRRNINPVDQFGRRWLTAYELATGDSTGGWMVAWGALGDPLRTPGKYLSFTRNESFQIEMGRCRVDFDQWITDIEQAETQWYEQLHQNALTKYTAIAPERVSTLDQDKFLVSLTGPKPFPSSEVLKRARGGEQVFLGLAPLTPEARALLRMPTLADLKAGVDVPQPVPVEAADDDLTPPDRYQDFVAWVQRHGSVPKGDLKAAAALWKEHREELGKQPA